MSTAEQRAARRAEPAHVHDRPGHPDGPAPLPDAAVADQHGAFLGVFDRGTDWSIVGRTGSGEKFGVGGLDTEQLERFHVEIGEALAARHRRDRG